MTNIVPENVTMTDVVSSNLKSIGYDAQESILYVTFTTDAVYKYLQVPVEVHTEIMEAESQGKYLNSKVKGQFPYERLK